MLRNKIATIFSLFIVLMFSFTPSEVLGDDNAQVEELRLIFVVSQSGNMVNGNNAGVDPDGERTTALQNIIDYLIEYDKNVIQPLFLMANKDLQIYVSVIYLGNNAELLQFEDATGSRVASPWINLNNPVYRNPNFSNDLPRRWKDQIENASCRPNLHSSPHCSGANMANVSTHLQTLLGYVQNKNTTQVGLFYITDGMMCGGVVSENCNIPTDQNPLEENQIQARSNHVMRELQAQYAVLIDNDYNFTTHAFMFGELYSSFSYIRDPWIQSAMFKNGEGILEARMFRGSLYPRFVSIVNDMINDKFNVLRHQALSRYKVNANGLIDVDGQLTALTIDHFTDKLTVIAGFDNGNSNPNLSITSPSGSVQVAGRSGTRVERWDFDYPQQGEWQIKVHPNNRAVSGNNSHDWVYVFIQKLELHNKLDTLCDIRAMSAGQSEVLFQYEKVLFECVFPTPMIENHALQERMEISLAFECGNDVCQGPVSLEYTGDGRYQKEIYFHQAANYRVQLSLEIDGHIHQSGIFSPLSVLPVTVKGLNSWKSCEEIIDYYYVGQELSVYYEFHTLDELGNSRLDFEHIELQIETKRDGHDITRQHGQRIEGQYPHRYGVTVLGYPNNFNVTVAIGLPDGYKIPLVPDTCSFVRYPIHVDDSLEAGHVVFTIYDSGTASWITGNQGNIVLRYQSQFMKGELPLLGNLSGSGSISFQLPLEQMDQAASYILQYQLVMKTTHSEDIILFPASNDGSDWADLEVRQ